MQVEFQMNNNLIHQVNQLFEDLNLLLDDILNEVSKSDEKDKKILELEQEISKNSFDDLQLLKESKILIPKLNSITISKRIQVITHSFKTPS
jgi:hypothetical protein